MGAVKKISMGFRKCIYANIFSIFLAGISQFYPLRISLILLTISTLFCLCVIIVQVHGFKKVFDFDLDSSIKELQDKLRRIDKNIDKVDYSSLLDPKFLQSPSETKQSFKTKVYTFFKECVQVLRFKT